MMSFNICDSVPGASGVSLNTQELSGATTSALTRVTDILNLPAEIHKIIASNLNSEDYASLRETCKSMSELLESFAVMSHRLKQNIVSGNTESNYREILTDNKIRKLLCINKTKELILAVRNCFAYPHPLFTGYTTVGTEYLPDTYEGNYLDRIDEVVNLCRCGIGSLVPSGGYKSFLPGDHPDELWRSAFDIDNFLINKKSMNRIFSSFNKAYYNTKGTEKLLVATLACVLKKYWSEKPPANLNKKDIVNLSVTYPELISIGDKTKKVLNELIR